MPKYLTTDEIREKFLNFFNKEHESTIVESSSLVPDNPTILLTTAGMVQFVPIFLGLKQPPYSPPRATTCQKCARAGGKDSDIENVGRTPRHHTFFEMLGNFSFGNYFKSEVIPWAWDFVTNHLGLEKDRLWVTIYEKDDEAFEIWSTKTDIPKERILRKGKKDNFWGPPGISGPCGPCSEIHYDLGEDLKCSDNCSIATCECDRWVEIWNLVFMELFQDEEGNLSQLEKKNVDTGMGLERIAMVIQGKTSTFDTDLLQNILNEVAKMANVKYKADSKTDVSLRIITDHIRCVSFMISDGVTPGNEGRNYVLRMILRRALRHGKILNLDINFLHKLVPLVIKNYGKAYPKLIKDEQKIIEIITKEENQFKATLDKGQKLLDELIEKASKASKIISGEDAFKLYDTFGFPLELTIEIAKEFDIEIDIKSFNEEMEIQKKRAKAAAQKVSLTDELIYAQIEQNLGSTKFLGYATTDTVGNITALVQNSEKIDSTSTEEIVDIILDKTPFYAECGGQIGDSGIIENDKFKAEVLTTFKVGSLFVHRAKLLSGEIILNMNVNAKVDKERRHEITLHHTLAHLLQAALISVVGDEVKQAGSQVEENRTRFDFSFSRAMTKDEIAKTEAVINSWIDANYDLKTEVMDINQAKSQGATALFGEKYDQNVRVVSIGNISKELCGGCHAQATGQLKLAKIISESAISAGARRIELVCSKSAIKLLNEKSDELDEIAHTLKASISEIPERVSKILEENRDLQTQISNLQNEMAKSRFSTFISKAKDIEGGKLFISKIEDFNLEKLDTQTLKNAIENFAQKLGNSIVVLVSQKADNTGIIFAKVSDNFVKKGINAGSIVKDIAVKCGGNGGGKPNFAQGGLKTIDNIDTILVELEDNFLK